MPFASPSLLTPAFPSPEENRHGLNLVWGEFSSAGQKCPQTSPLDGAKIQEARVLGAPDLAALFGFSAPTAEWNASEITAFAARLRGVLDEIRIELIAATRRETAFSPADCEEIVAGTLEYLDGFAAYYAQNSPSSPLDLSYAAGQTRRQIELKTVPWGTVAVMMPQNAALLVGVICLINALVTGNRVVLRASIQGALTAGSLALAIHQAAPPPNSVSIIVARGREFLEAAYASDSPLLVHYLGASQFGGDILKNAFHAQKPALIDGTGNTWVWVGKGGDVAQIARTLTAGATRYNGQTCTSINGAIIHPDMYADLCEHLGQLWREMDADTASQEKKIGLLFDAAQAQSCLQSIENGGGQIHSGGRAQANYLVPTLIENPNSESDLVREGVFGPVLWISPGTREDFARLWPSNRYPLCAGILEENVDALWWLARLPHLARLVLNGDPSVEHIYEPWGAYPASGANGVSLWHQKYQRVVSLDSRAKIES